MKVSNFSLPSECTVRPATSNDAWSIRYLVFSAILDPTQLHWQQFWLIECQGEIVACGQLRNFYQAQELGSLVVKPAWRGRGLATFLIQHLINTATQPLYLECLGERLAKFYQRFDFVATNFEDLPNSIQKKFKFTHLAQKLGKFPIVFMQHHNFKS